MTLDFICLLNSKLTHIVTLSTPGGRDGVIDSEDSRFCFISNQDLKFKLQADFGLSRIVFTEDNFRLSKISRANNSHMSILVAVEGSLMSKNSRRTCACSVYFRYNSTSNFSVSVPEKRSSTIPEIHGIAKAVRTAKHNQMTKLTIISDSALAIKLCYEALTTPIMSSAILQHAVQVESNLTPIFNQLRASFFLLPPIGDHSSEIPSWGL